MLKAEFRVGIFGPSRGIRLSGGSRALAQSKEYQRLMLQVEVTCGLVGRVTDHVLV